MNGSENLHRTMDNRTRIGFYYVWDKSWMGGVTYARNLLRALNTLDDKDKPFINVYCRSTEAFEDLKGHTHYPYLDCNIIRDEASGKKFFRDVVRTFFGFYASKKVDMFKVLGEDQMIFPYGFGSALNKLVYWCPDFQEKYLPEFFSERDIRKRDLNIRAIARRGIPIVFSSHDCEKDFRKFYPEYNNKTFVVHFAVIHPDFSHVRIDDVKAKYGIKGNYLLCANQFWKHKNHLFLFKAYHKAVEQGFDMPLVCTGNLSDCRNPEYTQEIKDFIESHHLSERIRLLGLIDSDSLHCLMKNAYAVVQPSLFEGWNTTVEDCKALNKFIFLSNLPVHQEQINRNVCFFNPHDEEELAQKLLTVKPTSEPYDYSRNLREFGENFLEVIKYVVNK